MERSVPIIEAHDIPMRNVRRRPGTASSHGDGDVEAALERARRLATLLDQKYRIPGTGLRFGLDSIVGLIPVVGDTATALVGAYPVLEGVRLGVRKRVVARMIANLGLDWAIGLIPVADIVLDVFYKANVRNVRLLERELRRKTTSS